MRWDVPNWLQWPIAIIYEMTALIPKTLQADIDIIFLIEFAVQVALQLLVRICLYAKCPNP